jgi:hypothetical protein
MKLSFLFLVFLFTITSYGQFAVVSDKDGYTNVRKDAVKKNNIIDSLKNGHLIYCFENKDNWTNIDYSKKNKELNGYIYSDRYKVISSYLIIPIGSQTKNSVRLAKDSIEVLLTQKSFDKTKHKFKYFKEANNQIELIDNENYWGADGGMPKIEYQKIKVKVGHKTIDLPKAATKNLFEPSIYNTQVNFDKERNIIYIHSMNSDGAGAYEVIWKIENGTYKERFIAYGF